MRFYRSLEGRAVVDEWLAQLKDRAGRARIDIRLGRLENGNFGDCKPVGAGILELRIDFGPSYRIYLAEDGPSVVLLLAAGDKNTQSADIRRAQTFWTDYQRRKSFKQGDTPS